MVCSYAHFGQTPGAETPGGAVQKLAKGCFFRHDSCVVVTKVELDAISFFPTLILGSRRIEISAAGLSGFVGSIWRPGSRDLELAEKMGHGEWDELRATDDGAEPASRIH